MENQPTPESNNSYKAKLLRIYHESKDYIVMGLIALVAILIVILNGIRIEKEEQVDENLMISEEAATSTEQVEAEDIVDEGTIKRVTNSRSIKDDYIIDTDAVNVLIPSLQERTNINPQFLCTDILEKRETRNNVYYFVLNEYNKLVATYGIYQDAIPFIKDDLARIYSEVQFTVSECAKRGYHI